jgi:hypothetical protein
MNFNRVAEYLTLAVCIIGVIFVVYKNKTDGAWNDNGILAWFCLPFLIYKLVDGLIQKETITGGMPTSVSERENPNLYWLVIASYILFLLIAFSVIIWRFLK